MVHMSILANIVIAASFLCPLTFAKVCAEGASCPDLHDETSLLQLDKAMKRGHGRGQAQDPSNSAEATLVDDSEKVNMDALKDSAEAEHRSQEDLGEDEYVGEGSETFCMNTRYIRIGGGDYYRRDDAVKARLGWMGNMQDCSTCSGNLDFEEPPNPAWIEPTGPVGVQIDTHIDMSSQESSKFSVEAEAAVAASAANAKANGGVSGSHGGSAALKAVVLRFRSRRALLDSLNQDSKRRADLKSMNSPRIVIGIMRLESAGDFTDNRCLDGSGGASGGDATGKMTAGASGTLSACAQMTASFSAGTVIAYRICIPTFDKKTGLITKCDIDQPCSYLNPTCGCNTGIAGWFR